MVLLALTGWLLLLVWVAASVDIRGNGLFRQRRIGRWGRPFTILKIRTMRDVPGLRTTVTTTRDPRITPLGALLRRLKLDELPQLINVLVGHMSFVGPRPDVPGFADRLEGEFRAILALRPGITGPASLSFRDEEQLLAAQPDPEAYNRDVLYPAKCVLNLAYLKNLSIQRDLQYIFCTLLPRACFCCRNLPLDVDMISPPPDA
ncbi:MAG: sugar transferase [Holophagaceae bacterium]|nr:sugar transferase [Holophagaceae bacterium]